MLVLALWRTAHWILLLLRGTASGVHFVGDAAEKLFLLREELGALKEGYVLFLDDILDDGDVGAFAPQLLLHFLKSLLMLEVFNHERFLLRAQDH